MMHVPDTFESLVALATALKQGQSDPSGVPDSVIVTRDGSPIALLQAPTMGMLLPSLPVLVAGLGADVVGLVVEGVIPRVPSNPVTGAPWQAGEAVAMWENGDGLAQSWVAEAQLVTAMSRDGETLGVSRAFILVDGAVVWLDEQVLGNDGLLQILAHAFHAPVPRAPQLDPDVRDGLVLQLLQRQLPDAAVRTVRLEAPGRSAVSDPAGRMVDPWQGGRREGER